MQQGVFLPHPIARGRMYDQSSFGAASNGYIPKIMRRLDILLTSAQSVPKEFRLTGTVLWAIDATDNDTMVEIRLGEDGDFLRVKRGFFIGGVPFEKLYIKWEAQAAKTIYLVYGVDYPFENVRNM